MPNWCENCLTFMSNGTPEGNVALQDFHDKLFNVYNLLKMQSEHGDVWEVDIEQYMFNQDMCNGLFKYKGVPFYKRGYIAHISEVNYNTFQVVTYDAWSANNLFWLSLITNLYGNLITFTFISNEPGMGMYYTNDEGILPRYSMNVIAYGADELNYIPAAWNEQLSDNLFKCLNTDNPYVYSVDRYQNAYPSKIPHIIDFSFEFNAEGNDDELINECEDYILGSETETNIQNISQLQEEIKRATSYKITTNVNQYEYTTLEDELNDYYVLRKSLEQIGGVLNERFKQYSETLNI